MHSGRNWRRSFDPIPPPGGPLDMDTPYSLTRVLASTWRAIELRGRVPTHPLGQLRTKSGLITHTVGYQKFSHREMVISAWR